MKATIRTRLWLAFLLLLFSAGLITATDKPNKDWKGLWQINDKYDWLCPPDRVLEVAIAQSYEGLRRHENFLYSYKQSITVDSENRIEKLWLESPLAAAAGMGAVARSDSQQRPELREGRANNYSLGVAVIVQTRQTDDLPKIAIFYRGTIILPRLKGLGKADFIACNGSAESSCWFTGSYSLFVFDEGTRLSGPAQLLIRWNSFERAVPLDFDYIW